MSAAAAQQPGTCALVIAVRYSAGAHITATWMGHRASSTASAEEAARRLGRKAFGERLVSVTLATPMQAGCEAWCIEYRPE